MTATPSGKRAFTLVELLVVIGIIALLISILMPALSSAKRQANTVKCNANLHNIGQVMQMYATDYKGKIPRNYEYGQQYLDGHIFWAEAFGKYFDKNFVGATDHSSSAADAVILPSLMKIGVYHCPARPDLPQPVDYCSNAWPVTDSATATGSEPSVNVTKLKLSSEIVFLIESNIKNLTTDTLNHYDIVRADCLPMVSPATVPPTINTSNTCRVLQDNRHGVLLNILYLDGHAASKQWRDVTEFDMHPK